MPHGRPRGIARVTPEKQAIYDRYCAGETMVAIAFSLGVCATRIGRVVQEVHEAKRVERMIGGER